MTPLRYSYLLMAVGAVLLWFAVGYGADGVIAADKSTGQTWPTVLLARHNLVRTVEIFYVTPRVWFAYAVLLVSSFVALMKGMALFSKVYKEENGDEDDD